MNRFLRSAVLAVALLAAAGSCESTSSTSDDIVAGTTRTAIVAADVGEAIFWQFPRFLLWTVPKALVYDLPRAGILAIRGNRAKVEDAIGKLEREDLSLEEEVEISRDLREMTGLPIRSTERWRGWWERNRDTPERSWRKAFVTRAIRTLTAPDYFDRATAIEDLRALYGTDLGYDPKSLPGDLEEAARRWMARFAKEGLPPRHGDPLAE